MPISKPLLLSLMLSLLVLSPITAANPFFAKADLIEAKLSPNGQRTLLLKNHDDSQQVLLGNTANDELQLMLDLASFAKGKSEATIRRLQWIDDNHFAAQYTEDREGLIEVTGGDTVYHLLVVDVGEPGSNKATIKSVRTRGYLVDPLSTQPGVFLYAKTGLYSKVYRVSVNKLAPHNKRLGKLDRIDGGVFTKSREVASVDGIATRWFIDGKGQVKAVLYRKRISEKWSQVLSTLDENGKDTILKTWSVEALKDEDIHKDFFMPYALTEKAGVFYGIRLAKEDRRTVYRIDYNAGTEEVVYQTGAFELVDVLIDDHSHKLIGVKVIDSGRIDFVYLDDANDDELAGSVYENYDTITRIASSSNKQGSLYYVAHHNQPGLIVHKTSQSGKVRIVGGYARHLNDTLKSAQFESSVEIQGRQVHYLLNTPAKSKKAPPLIVMPHGGPFGMFDKGDFNRNVQYLVSRGFAVLRVNFRGSGGYSEAFEDAGKKQWGTGMIDDIHQVTETVLKQHNINPDRVCASGMSYGGYASLMLVIRFPERYKCAVSIAGVTDINLHLRNTRFTDKQMQWSKDYIGDAQTQYDMLKQMSPVYLVEQVTRPIYLVHGAKDTIVDPEQAFRMKHMLDKHGKKYEWLYDPEAQHDYGTPAQHQHLFETVVRFVEGAF